MQSGERYERYVVDGSIWRHEIRRILDVSCFGVLYQIDWPPPEGTYVGFDNTDPPVLLSHAEWEEWAQLARKLDEKSTTQEANTETTRNCEKPDGTEFAATS